MPPRMAKNPCHGVSDGDVALDLIYIDLIGVRHLQRNHKRHYASIKCILRVLDSFGTQPRFNSRAAIRRGDKAAVKASPWGYQDLHVNQFYTMFPHTDDNRFLGFAVDTEEELRLIGTTAADDSSTTSSAIAKRTSLSLSLVRSSKTRNSSPTLTGEGDDDTPIALVYGKHAVLWGTEFPLEKLHRMLEIVSKHIPVHATVGGNASTVVPAFVTNHGVLSQVSFRSLLKRARLFIGVGQPFEGPAPLEAIAAGSTFIQPRFEKPLNRENHRFFKGKPTSRGLTSQHPYMESLGPPFSYLIDLDDTDQIDKVVRKAVSHPRRAFVPFEFTRVGMLERLAYDIAELEVCANRRLFPLPVDDLRAALAGPRQSCQEACRSVGLRCHVVGFEALKLPTRHEIPTGGHHELPGVELDLVDVAMAMEMAAVSSEGSHSASNLGAANISAHLLQSTAKDVKEVLPRISVHCSSFAAPEPHSTIMPLIKVNIVGQRLVRGECVVSGEPQLASCSDAPQSTTERRICPCRTAQRFQSALCATCQPFGMTDRDR